MMDDPNPGEKRRVEFLGGPYDGETSLMRVARVEWIVPTRRLLSSAASCVAAEPLHVTTGLVGVYRRSSDTTFSWQGYR